MKAQLNPGWLVSLMCRWSMRQLKGESGSLGYPTKAPGFSEKTTGGYSHNMPCAFRPEDFTDLEKALSDLKQESMVKYISMMMHYKPWVLLAANAEGYPYGNSTYYQRLHSAHAIVSAKMDCMKQKCVVN